MDVRYSRRAMGIALGLFGVMALICGLTHLHSQDASAPVDVSLTGDLVP